MPRRSMDIHILEDVGAFLQKISPENAAKISAHLKSLEGGRTEGLMIKSLKGRVQEIIVRQYRIIFFRIGGTVYVVDAFRKQSAKTPLRIIERAEKIYKDIAT